MKILRENIVYSCTLISDDKNRKIVVVVLYDLPSDSYYVRSTFMNQIAKGYLEEYPAIGVSYALAMDTVNNLVNALATDIS